MTKGAAADAKLFYAASSSNGMCDLASLCEIIADRSAATAGDVKLVLDGLLFVVKQKLQDGQTIQLGDLGYFQAVLGSKGSPTKKEFTTDLVRRPRVVFRPGKTLLELAKKLKVERMVLDKNEPDSGSGSGGGDRPEIGTVAGMRSVSIPVVPGGGRYRLPV